MKRLLSPFVIALSMLLVLSSASAATDLPNTHLFYDEIDYLMERDVITGYPDGTVRPDAKVTRAEAAVMIGRLKEFDGALSATPFSDVPTGHYASGYIAEAAKAGLLKGYPDGTYRPNAPIIRGDMAVILDRIFSLGVQFGGFADVKDGVYYSEAISKMRVANIAIGYPDNTFRPQSDVTRGQFAAFLARALEPFFKNRAVIPHSYQKDKTKAFTYLRPDGSREIHRYIDVPDKGELEYGFMWTVKAGDDIYEYQELESYTIFAFGYPYSEYDIALVYPVKVGQKITNYLGDEKITNTITAVNKTVKTRYKTFTNATEVTAPDGLRYYMAEGYSTIKTIDAQGQVVFELIAVE
ncbi:hypothetical protein HNQ44_000764 [Planomicrobium koreense]|uniref:SLH domain-containing protein n=1 Tax=Planococcus koreensis TaxID=112331 RepID=A0A7W8CPN6_9BACL|nr:S-layer homology domain-containing protein [Planococcus koreensis]MBB5179340.1 hypothetical protein [Planococcus koreensis]